MPMRHSVVMDHKRCRGCTSCIKCCPTEAIRVRGRKATILPDRCIDCGNCIKPFQPLRPEDYQKLEKALVDLYDGGIA